MHQAKRIFVIADFKDERPWSIFMEQRRIVKGLLRLGHDVQRFSYRNTLMQFSPLPSKKLAKHLAKRKTNEALLRQIKHYYPDIVLVECMDYVDSETVCAMREAARNAVFVGRDGDPFPEKYPKRLATGREMDIVAMPSAGTFLKTYKDAGVRCCAFIPYTCDLDIQYKREVQDKWKADIAFLGTADHSRLARHNDRYSIVKRLSQTPNAKLYGCFGGSKTDGLDCFHAICGAKIGLSINIANDVYLYHSDRLINIPACGTFTLAKRVPGYELLFKDGVHMRYFDTVDEFFELADWYLKHDQEREKIAEAGMQRAHQEFNCQRVARLMLDLIQTGTYDAPWRTIL